MILRALKLKVLHAIQEYTWRTAPASVEKKGILLVKG